MYFVNGAEKLHYVVDVYHRLIFCLNKKVPKSISGPKAAMAYKASATQFEKIISVLDAANIATKEDVMGGGMPERY